MKLSRLTNRQLRNLLRRGEVRFANDEEQRLAKAIMTLESIFKTVKPLAIKLMEVSNDLRDSDNPDIIKASKILWDKASMINKGAAGLPGLATGFKIEKRKLDK